jgi:hypothetical protein
LDEGDLRECPGDPKQITNPCFDVAFNGAQNAVQVCGGSVSQVRPSTADATRQICATLAEALAEALAGADEAGMVVELTSVGPTSDLRHGCRRQPRLFLRTATLAGFQWSRDRSKASAIGNTLVQARVIAVLPCSLKALRALVRRTFTVERDEPRRSGVAGKV